MKDELITNMQDLMKETLEDKRIYEQASTDAEDENLKYCLKELAEQKAQNSLEIKEVLSNFGIKSETREDIVAEKSSAKKGLGALFTTSGDKYIIENCISRENTVENRYKGLIVEEEKNTPLYDMYKEHIARSVHAKAKLWEQNGNQVKL